MTDKHSYANFINELAGDYVQDWVGKQISEMLVERDDHITELEAAFHEIISTAPEGDTDYKYGYAWERCIRIASIALGPDDLEPNSEVSDE